MYPVTIKPSSESTPQSEIYPAPTRSQGLDIARSLRMNTALAVGVAVVVTGLAIIFGLTRHAQFEAHSLVYIQPLMARTVTDASGGSFDPNRYDSYVQQQLQTVVRPDILAAALKRLPAGSWQGPAESEQSAVARLQGALKVERLLGSYQLSIGLSGGDPVAVTRVVNAVTTAYLEKGRDDEHAQSDQQLELLKVERTRLLSELEKSRQEQAELSATLGVADTAGYNSNPYDIQLEELRKQLASARATHAVAEAQFASVVASGSQPSEALNAAADELAATDAGLSSLKSAASQRRSLLTSQMAGLTADNPLHKQDEEELARLDGAVQSLTTSLRKKAAQQIQEKYKLESARTSDVVARLARQLGQQTVAATEATPKLQRASDLAMSIKRLQANYAEVDNAVQSIELQHSSGLIRLSLAAVQPQTPKTSKKMLILSMALPLGILIGILTAVVRQRFDQRVYIGEDVLTTLNIQPMAVLPSTADVELRVADEFMLRLVAGVDQAHRVGDARTYVFTAASSETNITGLVSSLASKMDRLGYRTLILRASDALENITTDDDRAAKMWGENRLTRSNDPLIPNLRRTSFVAENIERLKENVDFLFIEAYPLLNSAETEFVARLVDATILIAESGKTTRGELKDALELVRRLSVPGVAVVLNDVTLDVADDDFVASVRSVENRQADFRQREAAQPRLSGRVPLGIYSGAVETVPEDETTATQR